MCQLQESPSGVQDGQKTCAHRQSTSTLLPRNPSCSVAQVAECQPWREKDTSHSRKQKGEARACCHLIKQTADNQRRDIERFHLVTKDQSTRRNGRPECVHNQTSDPRTLEAGLMEPQGEGQATGPDRLQHWPASSQQNWEMKSARPRRA